MHATGIVAEYWLRFCLKKAHARFEKYQLYFMICDFAQGTNNFAQSFATIF